MATEAASYDIGTPLDYYDTSMAFAEREGTAPRHRSILWDDVEIGDGAVVDRCIVTDGVRVPPRTSWSGQILRRLDGELAPGEQAIAGLAISPLDFQS
jgi:NDP-sugar pyrophosphorylase family protein